MTFQGKILHYFIFIPISNQAVLLYHFISGTELRLCIHLVSQSSIYLTGCCAFILEYTLDS